MKYAHNVQMRVFCREGEDCTSIIDRIHEIFPMDFEKEKIEIRQQNAEGFEEKKIKIFRVFIKKQRHTNLVLKNLMENLEEKQKDLLRKQMDTRLDKNLDFYIRLNKDRLIEGEYFITDSGRCFWFKISVAAYPHKREVARDILEELLNL